MTRRDALLVVVCAVLLAAAIAWYVFPSLWMPNP